MNLIREQEVADLLDVALTTVQQWRRRNQGPPYYKFSGSIRYSKDEVITWLKTKRTVSTKETRKYDKKEYIPIERIKEDINIRNPVIDHYADLPIFIKRGTK